ncbi:MAG: M14 family metallopeptidase [Bacteroidales bacterium]|nr:M14 family metallopeptidase [Bacteroidales bacterium]
MKRKLFFSALVLLAANVFSQDYIILNPVIWTESDANDSVYTVNGYRHGVSFFPQVKHDDVEYVAGDELSFDKFHSVDVINEWLLRWSKEYPDLVDLYQIAESYEGRPILQMTITNKNKGKHSDKPAAFFEGNRHSGEITGSESVMWLAQHLLRSYGKDDEISRLIDNFTFYLRPVNNPDGHNLYMHTAQSNRSTVRPTDNDFDGLIDEDSPDDINGDGIILSMRWKDEEKGNMIVDPDDPGGRIMKRVSPGEGDYMVGSEGIDNDGDGRINEDGIGGLDLHRNYPENWRPESNMDATGRGFTQRGAGEYPLSETETRSVVTFLLSHPNVYIVNSMDTRVPMHLRPPSTSPSNERMYEEDLEWYKRFDDLGKSITGYERAGDVYQDYGGGNPLFGHGPDFGYWYYGSIWYGDELWNGARFKDYDGDDDIDELDLLRWDEEENDGDGFIEWTEAVHPVYGKVEIGGFHPKFFSQNPPAKHLLPWAKNQALFNLEMVKHLPMLEWDDIRVKKEKSYRKDSTDYRITVSYRNTGKLPTALKQAHLVKIVKEDQVTISFDRKLVGGKEPVMKIISEEGSRGRSYYGRFGGDRVQSSITLGAGYARGGSTNSREFTIRVYKEGEIPGKATVSSTRGGILKEKEFVVR